ncbi:hypothetical protein, partial [Microbacterium sp.]|uniref:hypothetical protein n=1 Tax=Microbacterium sp. TaxID=51671 RepID=UPI0032216B00
MIFASTLTSPVTSMEPVPAATPSLATVAGSPIAARVSRSIQLTAIETPTPIPFALATAPAHVACVAQAAGVDPGLAARDDRAGVEPRERVAVAHLDGDRPAHRRLAARGAGLHEHDVERALLGRDVEAAVRTAADRGARAHDGVRGHVVHAEMERAAEPAPLAGRAHRREREAVAEAAVLRVEVEVGQREVAGHLDQLLIVQRHDRHGLVRAGGVAVRVVGVGVGVAPLEVLVDPHAVRDRRDGGAVGDEHGDRPGDAELVGRGRGRRPRGEEAFQPQRAVDVLGDRLRAVLAHAVDELAGRQRQELVELLRDRVRDHRHESRGPQRVQLGARRSARGPADRDGGVVVDHADDDGHARHRVGARPLRRVRAVQLRLRLALRSERELLDDRGDDLEVFVGLQHGVRADDRVHVVVGVDEREPAGDADGCLGVGALRGRCGHVVAVGLGRRLEQQVGEIHVDLVLDLRPLRGVGVVALALQSRGGRGAVRCLQRGRDAEAGGEARVEHVLADQPEVAADGIPEVDDDAGERLVLGEGEAEHLGACEPAVALQVVLVGARDDVVGRPVDEAGDRRAGAGAVDHRLAERERVEHRLARCAVDPDRVGHGIDAAAAEGVCVVRRREGARARDEVDDVAGVVVVAGARAEHGELGRCELDPLAGRLVVRGPRVVLLEGEHVVLAAVDESADARAAAVLVRDRVLGGERVGADADGVVLVVDVADRVALGEGRRRVGVLGDGGVDLDLDDRAGVHAGDDGAVDGGGDVGGGEVEREREGGVAVGVHARLGLGLGLHRAAGADVDGPAAVDDGAGGDVDRGGGVGPRDRERQRDLRAARVGGAVGGAGRARAHGCRRARVRGDDDRLGGGDLGVGDVDGRLRLRLRVADAEQAARRGGARVRSGGRVEADDAAGAGDLRPRADRDRRGRGLHEHRDGQRQDRVEPGPQRAGPAEQRVDDVLVDLVGGAE